MGTIKTCINNMISSYDTIIRMENIITDELATELDKILKDDSETTYQITVSHVLGIRVELKNPHNRIPLQTINQIAWLIGTPDDIEISSTDNKITIIYRLIDKTNQIRKSYGDNKNEL